MKKISLIILALPLPLALTLACGKVGGSNVLATGNVLAAGNVFAAGNVLAAGNVFAARYKPGDRAAVNVDVDGDRVGEMLVVESFEPTDDMGLAFKYTITLTNPRGNVLYQSEEIGELDWFSVDVSPFQYENGTRREIALIRSGCSGTGVHVYAILLYQPPRTDTVISTTDGNEGLYDADGDGFFDSFVSVYRMQNLGIYGVSSPWLPTFSRPASSEDWGTVDITFDVLAHDEEMRGEWVKGIKLTYEGLSTDFSEGVPEDHLKYLKMLAQALEAGDMAEAANVYYTGF